MPRTPHAHAPTRPHQSARPSKCRNPSAAERRDCGGAVRSGGEPPGRPKGASPARGGRLTPAAAWLLAGDPSGSGAAPSLGRWEPGLPPGPTPLDGSGATESIHRGPLDFARGATRTGVLPITNYKVWPTSAASPPSGSPRRTGTDTDVLRLRVCPSLSPDPTPPTPVPFLVRHLREEKGGACGGGKSYGKRGRGPRRSAARGGGTEWFTGRHGRSHGP